jgi:hypothetical protein
MLTLTTYNTNWYEKAIILPSGFLLQGYLSLMETGGSQELSLFKDLVSLRNVGLLGRSPSQALFFSSQSEALHMSNCFYLTELIYMWTYWQAVGGNGASSNPSSGTSLRVPSWRAERMTTACPAWRAPLTTLGRLR